MKRTMSLLLLLALLLSVPSFSQQYSQEKTKAYYQQKRKNNKTAAWLLLGSGVTLSTIGFAVNMSQPWVLWGPSNSNADKGMGVFYVGTVVTVASIPFFFIAHKNKKKAASFSINNQPVYYPVKNGWASVAQPGIRMVIPL